MLTRTFSPTMALERLARRTTLPVSANVAVKLADLFTRWSDRRRSRAALYRLPPHLLKDVGLNQISAHEECEKPFWRP